MPGRKVCSREPSFVVECPEHTGNGYPSRCDRHRLRSPALLLRSDKANPSCSRSALLSQPDAASPPRYTTVIDEVLRFVLFRPSDRGKQDLARGFRQCELSRTPQVCRTGPEHSRSGASASTAKPITAKAGNSASVTVTPKRSKTRAVMKSWIASVNVLTARSIAAKSCVR